MRAPNARRPRVQPTITLELPHAAFEYLKHNQPGPSGTIGGYGQFENFLIAHGLGHALTVPGQAYVLELDDTKMGRLIRYILSYEGGGPNNRIRQAFSKNVAARLTGAIWR